MAQTVALIDGDIIAYEIAVGAQTVINWSDEGEDDLYTASMNGDEVRARLVGYCTKIANDIGADNWQVCLTGRGNWRKAVLPTYKGNRVYASKPIFLDAVKDLAREHLDAYHWEGFEADDMLGYLATSPEEFGNDRAIICSIDKDMRCVPGLHWNWSRNVSGRKQEGIVNVSQEQADRFHLYQTLIGDQTDNYTGLPGCGPKSAEKILNASCTWPAVVSAYEEKGLTEEDALIQARVARILRDGEIDMEKMEPILWTP